MEGKKNRPAIANRKTKVDRIRETWWCGVVDDKAKTSVQQLLLEVITESLDVLELRLERSAAGACRCRKGEDTQ